MQARYAARRIKRFPYLVAAIVMMFGLGLGLATTSAELVYTFFYRALPVPDPDELVRFTLVGPLGKADLSYPAYTALTQNQGSFTDVFGWENQKLPIHDGNVVKEEQVGLVTGNAFNVLQINPVLGRRFSVEEDQTGGSADGWACLISYDYWRSHYQGRENVLSQTIVLSKVPATIIGVLPKGFLGIVRSQSPAIYCPLHILAAIEGNDQTLQNKGSSWLITVGRLKKGVSFSMAQADVARVKAGVFEQTGQASNSDAARQVDLVVERCNRGTDDLVEMYRQPLEVLAALSFLILTLCSANVAALYAAKITGEAYDIAVYVALGATSRDVVKRVMLEISALCLCGSIVGVFISFALTHMVVATLSTADYPVAIDLSVNTAHMFFYFVTLFALILSVGAISVWAVLGHDPVDILRKEGGGGQTGRFAATVGVWLVPLQIAISFILVFAAVLLGNSLHRLLPQHLGFNAKGVLRIPADFSQVGSISESRQQVYERILQELATQGGVRSASVEEVPMLSDVMDTDSLATFGKENAVHKNDRVMRNEISPNYFQTLGTTVLYGREFIPSDRLGGSPVCVINQAAASYFFPDGSPLDSWLFRASDRVVTTPMCQVVGVVEDTPYTTLRRPHEIIVYTPMWQDPNLNKSDSPTFLVRTSNALFSAKVFSGILSAEAQGASMFAPMSMLQLLQESTRQERLLSWISGILSFTASLLVCAGLYALLSHRVILRRREIGIRMALGGSRSAVVYETFRQVLKLVGIGIIAGALLSVGISKFVSQLLYHTNSLDPLLLGTAMFALVLMMLLAATAPALKAAKVNPVQALRWD